MKSSVIGLASLVLCFADRQFAFAQTNVYSANVVGYYNRAMSSGDNLIANQFRSGNDTLNNLLAYGVPDGTTLTKWDSVANAFLPISVFNASTTNWSINYSLVLA